MKRFCIFLMDALTENAKIPCLRLTRSSENTKEAPALAKSRKSATLPDRHWKMLRPMGQRSVMSPNINCKMSPQTTGLQLTYTRFICIYM